MTFRPVRPLDQPVELADSGGEVWPLALVDEQSAQGPEPLCVHGRHVDPLDEFDRIFFHGARG